MLIPNAVLSESLATATSLAQAKGCDLKVMQADERLFYWIENSWFVGRPYECLNDLIQFIQVLPLCLNGASDRYVSIATSQQCLGSA
ncbi:MAG TPA: hypothetical protein V6C84_01235 [Coleofasciculaceae cyanobacterium]|jgi:hypothetical protein